jgi:hypothetical protein
MARLALALALVVLVFGCKSDDPPDFPDPDVRGTDASPDGDPYPTDNIGGRARGGGRRGDRIANFTFQGYRDGDRSKGLAPISLAEYFDPKQKRHKILHLQVAATWCTICSSELSATVPVTAQLGERGVVFLEVIVSGPSAGRGPALEEVDEWVTRHKTNFSTAIDVRARRLGSMGVNPSVMPHDIMIDTRTMEILDSSVGAPIDVGRYVQSGLDFVNKSPPSY